MKWSKDHFNWPGSGLINLECTNVQDTWVAESNKGVHTLRMWHKEMGRWQGQRRSFKPQTLAGKMPSRRWVSGRVPGKSLVWIETSPWDFLHQRGRGGFTSHLFEFTATSFFWRGRVHLWFLPARGKPEQLTPLSSGSWQPLEVPVTPWQLRMMESTQLTIPLQSCFQQSQLHKLFPKYKLASILRVPANQKTLFLSSDCFKTPIYFTLLNTSTKEDEHLKPFILQQM